jgi:hypothetical protein
MMMAATSSTTNRHHSFHHSVELRKDLEAKFYRAKWDHFSRIVEDNDSVVSQGGFSVHDRWEELYSGNAAEQVVWSEYKSEHMQQQLSQVADSREYFSITDICVANVDSLTAALVIGDASVLNFANAAQPGGRYRSGGKAQEEDLCRLLPQLYESLRSCEHYPIQPTAALLSRDLKAVRRPGTYELCESQGEVTVLFIK